MPVNQFLRSARERRTLPLTNFRSFSWARVTGGATTHPAITRNLYTWTNYKNWADQVRDSWSSTENAAPAGGAKSKK